MPVGVCDHCRATFGYAQRALPEQRCPRCQQPLLVLPPVVADAPPSWEEQLAGLWQRRDREKSTAAA
jgi:hypothetical protein